MAIEKVVGSNFVDNSMMIYSAEELLNRALPDYRDGLKPVQKKILFTMERDKTYQWSKSANVAGQVFKVHPHAGSYPSIVNMVREDSNLIPFIDGHGTFGVSSSKQLPAAAERYTEVKLSSFGKEMTKDISKHLTPEVYNSDGTILVPTVLPVSFPTLLLQQQTGIGTGFATKTASFNINEITDYLVKKLENKKVNKPYPDFSTGGTITKSTSDLNSLYKTGSATFLINSKLEIADKKTIVITELPVGVNREAIVEKIIKVQNDKNELLEINSVEDYSDINGLNIEIQLKRGSDPEEVLRKLYQYTDLSIKFSVNNNVLNKNGLPSVMGVDDIIKDWIEWRKGVIVAKLKAEIKNTKDTLKNLLSYTKIANNIDKFINLVRNLSKKTLKSELKSEFYLNDDEVDFLLSVKLYNINKDYFAEQLKKVADLQDEIDRLNTIIGSDKELTNIIKDEISAIAKTYKTPRRTVIVD